MLLGADRPSAGDAAGMRVAERYEVRERLGQGGMAVIYAAFDRASGQVVALKRTRSNQPVHAGVVIAAFEREYRVLASLDHPRIVRAFDYGVDANGPFYTMELVDGADMLKALHRPWIEVCSSLCEVSSALLLLHARRLLHRDVSVTEPRRSWKRAGSRASSLMATSLHAT